MSNKTKEKASCEIPYSKEQFIKSKKYASLKYALEAILEDGKQYTKTQVEALLDEFMRKKVN